MSVQDRVEIQDYLSRFWRAMDRSDYPEVLRGLTAECRWSRDRWREGHADILESLKQRPALLFSRHNVSNLILDPNEDGYDCNYGLIIFGYTRASADEKAPYTTTGPRMGDWRSKLVKVEGAWRAKEISAALLFERPQ